MMKFRLFREFNEHEIYGESLGDAIVHAGPITRLGRWDVAAQTLVRGEELLVTKVLGMEHTGNSERGNHKFLRAIVETTAGTRLSIDAVECGEIQEVA